MSANHATCVKRSTQSYRTRAPTLQRTRQHHRTQPHPETASICAPSSRPRAAPYQVRARAHLSHHVRRATPAQQPRPEIDADVRTKRSAGHDAPPSSPARTRAFRFATWARVARAADALAQPQQASFVHPARAASSAITHAFPAALESPVRCAAALPTARHRPASAVAATTLAHPMGRASRRSVWRPLSRPIDALQPRCARAAVVQTCAAIKPSERPASRAA